MQCTILLTFIHHRCSSSNCPLILDTAQCTAPHSTIRWHCIANHQRMVRYGVLDVKSTSCCHLAVIVSKVDKSEGRVVIVTVKLDLPAECEISIPGSPYFIDVYNNIRNDCYEYSIANDTTMYVGLLLSITV